MKLELEISERAYNKLRTEVFTAMMMHGDSADIRTRALSKMFQAWDEGETPGIKAKGDE